MSSERRYPRRLIEVDLPIKKISAHARREKSIRHGHISTLHIWWARRPLAACRAVILAALWPDPADPLCPERFRVEATDVMKEWRSRRGGPQRDWNDSAAVRAALLDFIAEFANWDNSTSTAYLAAARRLVQVAHESLGGTQGTRPLVVDPFAGGGAIPLEALRVGADAFASDLNPVAVLLNKVVLEYVPRYGQQLPDEVRKWGQWVKEHAQRELACFYPKDPDGATPIAYLWARTIKCEGPGCGAEVPLMRSLWLAKKPNRSVALRLVPDQNEQRIEFEIVHNPRNCDAIAGTVNRGAATCPCCGYTTAVQSVRRQLRQRKGGAADARLLAVATLSPAAAGRSYRLPNTTDVEALGLVERAALSWLTDETESSPVPSERFSGLEPRRIPLPQYGIDGFRDMFTPRQAISLATIARLIARAGDLIAKEQEPDAARAIATILALSLSKQADLANSLCGWKPDAECPVHLFARQAMPMVWDFAESVPTSESSGSWSSMYERSAHALESAMTSAAGHATIEIASATRLPIPDDSADAVVTDPPYYYSVPYADLSDFFYVWLRRALKHLHPSLFASATTPKDQECVQNLPHASVRERQKDREFFERTLTEALAEARRGTKPQGIGVVVFAHSDTDAWESMLAALVAAGWCVTASWPIDTEMAARTLALRQSTLASSIHLVCRPREDESDRLTSEIGDWSTVLRELPTRIHEWMPRLASEGVVGADAIFACLGPALEIFSRYARVEKASGESVALREYLEQVWAAVAREALSMIFEDADATGLEEDARLTAMWLWTLSTSANRDGNGGSIATADEEGDAEGDDEEVATGKAKPSAGFSLEFDAARKIAQGLGAHLEDLSRVVEIKGDQARLLSVAERTRDLFGKDQAQRVPAQRSKKAQQLTLFEELEAAEKDAGWGDVGLPPAGETTLDRVHQAMVLFAAARGEALKRFLVEEGVGRDARFWTLAQSLSALYPAGTDEKRWVDGVLARKKGLGFG